MSKSRVVIVGSGLSALILANELGKDFDILIVEKARGVGGRLCTRRFGSERLDHGAISLSALGEEFLTRLSEWEARGVVRKWCRLEGRDYFSCESGISALAKYLAQNIEIKVQERLVRIESSQGAARLVSESGNNFDSDIVVMTAPVPQTLEIFSNSALSVDPEIVQELGKVRYDKCLAALALFDVKVDLGNPYGWAKRPSAAFENVFDNTIKQGRSGSSSLSFHFSKEFSDKYFDVEKSKQEDIIREEIAGFVDHIEFEMQSHRWRYSTISHTPFDEPLLVNDLEFPLIVSGEAFSKEGLQAEAAFNSGLQAAEVVRGLT